MSPDDIKGVLQKKFPPEQPPGDQTSAAPAPVDQQAADYEKKIADFKAAPRQPLSPEESARTGELLSGPDPTAIPAQSLSEAPAVLSPEIAQEAIRQIPVYGQALSLTQRLFPESAAGKLAGGAIEGGGDVLSGLTTPTNLALLGAGGPLAKLGKLGTVLLSSAFEAQALIHAPEQWQEFKAAYDSGDYEKATRLGIGMAAGLGLPAAAVAVHGAAPAEMTLSERLGLGEKPVAETATSPLTEKLFGKEPGSEVPTPATPLTDGVVKTVVEPRSTDVSPATAATKEALARLEKQVVPEPEQPPAEIVPGESVPGDKAVEVPSAAAAEGPGAEKITDAFSQMGKGITDNFYTKAFESLEAGQDTISGVKDPILEKAREAYDAGLIKSPEDLRDLSQSDFKPAADSLEAIAPETAQSVAAVRSQPEQADMIRGLATQAREMFGPGAADVGEFHHLAEQNAREYAAIGASHLLEGKADKASWVDAMRGEYGARDASPTELNKIWRDSHEMLADFNEAQTGKALRPKTQIEQATGIRETLGTLKEQLGDSITKAQGLSEYLRGSEKGGELGAKTRQEQLRMADKWMAADQEQVRQHLTNFVKRTLPIFERGRYIGAITRALRRPDLVKGDPTTMYRNAFRVMQAIENRSEDVHRGNVIADLKKISGRILDSPTVDLAAKRILQRTLKEINLRTPQKATVESLGKTREFLDRMSAAGRDVVMPQKVLDSLEQLAQTPIKELPTTTLDDLHTKVRLTEKIGRLRFKTRESAWSAEKTVRLDEIKAGDGTPLELREMFRPQPGEKLSLQEKVQNWMARRFNTATVFDMGHLPMDVHFDLLQNGKGTYTGPLFEHIRNPIDAAYDRAQRRAINELDPLRSLIKKNKLSDTDETRIGLWAQLQQEGGELRAMESGVDKATIDRLKAEGLTPGQKEAYDYMRGRLDATLPEVQTLMHDLFNIDVESVENYFPWMREWETFKPSADRPVFDARTGEEVSPEMLESFGQIAGDFTLPDTTKLQRGFTIEREAGAKTPIRMDAFDVFQRHMYAASRLLEMQRDLKLVGEIIRDDAFAKKFGTYGQKTLNDWVTATATDGRGGNVHRMPLLDMARKGSNRALVFFRLTSNIKHLSAVPQAIVNAGGPEFYFRGLHSVFSKEGKAFLENFPQVTERQAGDMSLQELQTSLGNDKSGIFPKGLAFADRYGFVLGKEIDALNSRAVFLGRYVRNLEDRGIKTGLSGPIDQTAAGNALAFMRRTVSSTLTKDVQPVLGRGQGFGGNISVARAMNAFRQYALERWSLLRYDAPQAFKSGNYTRGVALIAAATAAGLYETNIASAVRHAGNALIGNEEKDKEHETWLQRLMVDGFSMVPYANNVVSAAQWGQSGIPLIDNFVNAGKTAKRVASAKTEEGKKSAIISAGGAAAQLAGVPGSGVATSLAKDALVDKAKIKSQAKEAATARRAEKKAEED
jgi:hypothetical protein